MRPPAPRFCRKPTQTSGGCCWQPVLKRRDAQSHITNRLDAGAFAWEANGKVLSLKALALANPPGMAYISLLIERSLFVR